MALGHRNGLVLEYPSFELSGLVLVTMLVSARLVSVDFRSESLNCGIFEFHRHKTTHDIPGRVTGLHLSRPDRFCRDVYHHSKGP